MERKFNNGTRVIFQEPDGSYEVEGKKISEEQVEKLIALMDCRWIIVKWAKPPERQEIKYTPGALDGDKLSDDVLRKLVDGVPLNGADKQNIIASANGN